MKTPLTAICAALVLIVAALPLTSLAQGVEAARVQETVATARFKKAAPYRVGVAAGYLSNSWVVFCLQHIRYEAARHKEISEVLVTDAGFNPGKQVADIEDLISKNVNLILYWPVDEQAIQPALETAVAKGIPTVNPGGGFAYGPGTVANAFIDQVVLGDMVARQLFKDMRGKGKIIAMLPIPGTTAAVDQLAALKAAMKEFPQIELLSAEYGDWNRAKAKQITENLLQRHPRIDGAFSPAGQMSIGVAEAFEEAGRLNEVVMSPGDEYNGWLKWVAEHKRGGAVTLPTRVGQEAGRRGLRRLHGGPGKRGPAAPPARIAPAGSTG